LRSRFRSWRPASGRHDEEGFQRVLAGGVPALGGVVIVNPRRR